MKSFSYLTCKNTTQASVKNTISIGTVICIYLNFVKLSGQQALIWGVGINPSLSILLAKSFPI